MDGFIDFLQWPAMAVSLIAAYLVGAKRARASAQTARWPPAE